MTTTKHIPQKLTSAQREALKCGARGETITMLPADYVPVEITKATPGPWRIEWSEQEEYFAIRLADPQLDYATIALVDGPFDTTPTAETQANAWLIAAAPELLYELQHLVRLMEPLERTVGLGVPGLATLNAARAAIAKAGGHES